MLYSSRFIEVEAFTFDEFFDNIERGVIKGDLKSGTAIYNGTVFTVKHKLIEIGQRHVFVLLHPYIWVMDRETFEDLFILDEPSDH